MSSAARMVGLLALVALLVLGAAGLSGHLVSEDPCLPGAEGGFRSYADSVWNPPGLECVSGESSGADERRSRLSGSWPAFLAALAFGLAVLGLVARGWPALPAWLRLTAVTTLGFAFLGALTGEFGVQFALFSGFYVGLPALMTADWALRGGGAPWLAGFWGAVVTYAATAFATAGYLYGFGAAPYGVTVLLVAALAALPRRRLAATAPS